jgi:hypothetical protein
VDQIIYRLMIGSILYVIASILDVIQVVGQVEIFQATLKIDDIRSMSGASFYLGDCLVSWLRKKQSSVSLSTMEAKYIVTTTCCTQVL